VAVAAMAVLGTAIAYALNLKANPHK